MSLLSLVVATSRNGVIGRDGGLPWHIPSELQHFKRVTMGKPVIMGRLTWEGLPRKPLPGRHNIVMTRHAGYVAQGATIVASKALALDAAGDVPEVAVIGGGAIFELFLPDADIIYLTEVDLEVDGDTQFPSLNEKEWLETERFDIAADTARSLPGYVVRKLVRLPQR